MESLCQQVRTPTAPNIPPKSHLCGQQPRASRSPAVNYSTPPCPAPVAANAYAKRLEGGRGMYVFCFLLEGSSVDRFGLLQISAMNYLVLLSPLHTGRDQNAFPLTSTTRSFVLAGMLKGQGEE